MANQYSERKRFFSNTEKECSSCEQKLPYSAFYTGWSGGQGPLKLSWYCKECNKAKSREKHKTYKLDSNFQDSKRNTWIKRRHGISLEQYKEKLAIQNNECAICQVKLLTSGHGTHLDHCHKTGQLRKFLCTNCNRGLGHFKDNPKFLETAIDYLNAHNSSVDADKEVIPR